MQTDDKGNAIVWDVYYSQAKGQWSKDHGEYTSEQAAQAACDRLNAERPETQHKPRKRHGLKATAYKA